MIIISALLQATILDFFRIWGVKPDLLLGCLLIGAVFFEFKWALGFGILSGMLKDILGFYGSGANTLLFPLWVIAIIGLSRKVTLEHRLFMVLLAIILTVVNALICKFVFLFSVYIPSGIFIRTLILEALYLGLIIFLVFNPAQRYFKLESQPESDSDEDYPEGELPDFEEGQGL